MKKYINTKIIYAIIGLFVILLGTYFALCKIASDKALETFNKEMSKQTVLRGTVSADTITADIWGEVDFTNLVWLDEKGETVLHIKEGSFNVSTWDIITKNISITTLQEVNINDAILSLNFDKDMNMDILNVPVRKKGEHKQAAKPAARLPNLNLSGKLPQVKVVLNNCKLAVMHDKKYFVLNDVDGSIDSSQRNNIKINLTSGKFGGTIVGNKLQLNGKIAVDKQEPELNLNLAMYDIVPKSMGLGNVENTANVFAQVQGTLQHIIVDGALNFAELDIPALHFNDVKGNLHYENGIIDFKDVTAGLYGGSVEAFGTYNIDNRHYSIDAKGQDLLASVAAKSTKINCRVELDLKMRSTGDPKTVHTYGSFVSGAGSYMLVPFESISGKFSNVNKVLEFEDVVIKTKIGDVTTDGFKIVDGKLQIDNVFLKNPDNSEVIKVR